MKSLDSYVLGYVWDVWIPSEVTHRHKSSCEAHVLMDKKEHIKSHAQFIEGAKTQ